MPRAGPRGGGVDTRAEILSAARQAFANLGYSKATIRRIAAGAGVDPALIHHYFGTKADLYAASVELPIPASTMIREIVSDGVDVGRRLATLFFTVWDSEQSRAPLLAMLSGALTGHDEGVRAFREFLAEALLKTVAPLVPFPDRELRVGLAASHLVGVAIARYVVRLRPIADATVEDIINLVAPRIDSYLTEAPELSAG